MSGLDLLLLDDDEHSFGLSHVLQYARRLLRVKRPDSLPPRLALPLLSAHSKAAGHSVEAVFSPLLPWNRGRFFALLERKPRVVGISTVAMFHAPIVEAITSEVRRRSPDSVIVLGGHGAQDYSNIRALGDLTISLHGEVPLARVVALLKMGKTLAEVPGIEVQKDGSRTLSGYVRYEGMDKPLFPDWTIARDGYGRYPIEASRGCRYNCVFCDFPGKTQQVFRQPRDVVDEMSHTIAVTGVRRFDFVDATFTSYPEFIYGMCDEIERRGLDVDWHCFTRPDAYDRYPDLAERMDRAGCTWVFMGVESIHDPILARMRRGMTRKVVERGLDRVFKTRIKVHGNFIIGFPGETPETVRETAAFIRSRPFYDVALCTLGATPEMLEVAALDPARYGHMASPPDLVKGWKHDTADYPTAYAWTEWAVREINRGRLAPIALSPTTNHPEALPR